ncbi:MAG: hypothetical protein DCC75_13955 [Proteobacteria bacterium]|nr:MAG: hypothetical protein DCC75_13955 [Pseudomonadota bacterium]
MSQLHRTENIRGSSAIEASLGALPFLLVLLSGIELVRYIYAAQNLQYAVNRASRFTAIGDYSKVQDIKDKARTYATIPLRDDEILVCGLLEQNCTPATEKVPLPGEWFSLTIKTPFISALGGLGLHHTSTMLAKFEPDIPLAEVDEFSIGTLGQQGVNQHNRGDYK